MFELQLGDKVSVPTTLFKDGVFLTGRVGQGKSTTFLQIVFQLIKGDQGGVVVDPYGDLVKAVQAKVAGTVYEQQIVIDGFDVTLLQLRKWLKQGKLILISAHKLTDGERKCREDGIVFLKRCFKALSAGDWLLIDEVFSFMDDQIWKYYMSFKKQGLNMLFCDSTISKLSEVEREKFCRLVPNYIVYKTMNFDAVCLNRYRSQLNPKDIAAIQQYCFQLLIDGKIKYTKGVWPIGL